MRINNLVEMSENHNDNHEDQMRFDTLPNRLSAVRIACVPLVVYFLMSDADPMNGFIAAILFGIAGITDYFDGYYARIQKATTVVGKLLDPLADKFLVISSLIMLMHLGRMNVIVVILMICRELAITGLRALAAVEGIVIAASQMAKWKTATQMAAIPALMLHKTFFETTFHLPMLLIGDVLTYISLLISLWSAKDYIVDFFRNAKKRGEEKKAARLAKKELKKGLHE